MRVIVIGVLDVILVVAALASLLILATGGTVFYVAEHRVSAYHATNLLWGLLVLGVVRFKAFPDSGFLGFASLRTEEIAAQCRRFCHRLYDRLDGVSSRSSARVVTAILLASLVVKALNAWYFYGFYSGDDVEVHEMSLAGLLDWPGYQAWNLRSPFYPMVFVYPAQKLLYELGIQDEALLVFAGRMVVVVISTLTLLLVYCAARVRHGSISIALIAIAILASSKLHTTFAASVLPRSVAAFFGVLAFWLLARYPHRGGAITSGFSLGVGTSLRLGEGVFVLTAILDLLVQHRWAHAVIVGTVSGVTAGLILGVSDAIYYGETFSSLREIVRYTLVDQLSSRGFQPFHYYLSAVGGWASLPFLALVVSGARHVKNGAVYWGLLPILALSLLPHKESRYLVPVMPFLAMLAAVAVWRSLESMRHDSPSGLFFFRSPTLLVLVLVSSLLFELDGMRFRRTESSVDAARVIVSAPEPATAAVQDVWTAGGRIYLWRAKGVTNVTSGEPGAPDLARFDFVSLREDPRDEGLWRTVVQGPFQEVPLPNIKHYTRYRLFARYGPE